MEVLIIDKQDDYVHACSSFGTFWGIWRSPSSPKLKKYAVELDSNDIIFPNMLTLSSAKLPNIEGRDNAVYLTGFLEEIENDLLFLRIGTDLVMLETERNADYSKYIGQYIQVMLFKLHLYDLGLL